MLSLQSCWPTSAPSPPSATSAGRWGGDAPAQAPASAPAPRTQAWPRKTPDKEMATGAQDETLPSPFDPCVPQRLGRSQCLRSWLLGLYLRLWPGRSQSCTPHLGGEIRKAGDGGQAGSRELVSKVARSATRNGASSKTGMSDMQYLKRTYTEKLFVVYLKSNLTGRLILSGDVVEG